jgi:RsiW-degrading membrane proteinase PrsW (M82 family)
MEIGHWILYNNKSNMLYTYIIYNNINENFFTVFFLSLLGGLIPALFWLWFWGHEKAEHKEPKKALLLTFLLGMLGVFVCFYIQKYFTLFFDIHLPRFLEYGNSITNHPIINLIFVIVEEFVKFFAAYVVFFRTKLFNEPIDAFIYLMTAAIGFAAMENTLYLIEPIIKGQTIPLLINSNVRFIGANLLHITSSGLLSLFIAYSFCKSFFVRELYVWLGLTSAVLIHWLFNYMLINSSSESIAFVFLAVWATVMFIILSLERVKQIKC